MAVSFMACSRLQWRSNRTIRSFTASTTGNGRGSEAGGRWNYSQPGDVACQETYRPAPSWFAEKEDARAMLNLVVTLLIIALIAALLGFGGIASAAVGIAKVIFFVVLLFFLVAVLFGAMGRDRFYP
jgi:uncharacterized membrane protein YtjA (UPF0391 family)